MQVTLKVKRIFIGGAVAAALGIAGIGAAAVANATSSVPDVPQPAVQANATGTDTIPTVTWQPGKTDSGTASNVGISATSGALPGQVIDGGRAIRLDTAPNSAGHSGNTAAGK